MFTLYRYCTGLLLVFFLALSPELVQAQNNDGDLILNANPDTECMEVSNEANLGVALEPLAKYEAEDELFEFNEGNVSFETDPPQASSGTWTSFVPVKAFLLKQANTVYYWTFDGNGVTEFDYNSPVNDVSHFTFCKLDELVCDVPTLTGEDQIDEENRTLSNSMQDDEGISTFTFTTLDNFTVISISTPDDEPAASGFEQSGNTWTWEGGADPPTEVNFTLEAGPENSSTYFLEVTDNCDDPNTVTFDPAYEFGPAATEAQLAGNAPNPFSGQTTVEFALPEQTRVTVAVYDMMGRKVATLVDGSRRAGTHTVSWNGQSDGGQDLASGVYLLRMQASGESDTRRVTIVR